MKMHWDGRKCFLRFIRGTTQLDRHDAYPLCAGARTCFLDNGRTRLSLPLRRTSARVLSEKRAPG